MSPVRVMVFGGSGFIGRRLTHALQQHGADVVVADIAAPPGARSGEFVRCDLRRFDDVVSALVSARPARVVNLAYMLGFDHPPHVALQLNVLGMDNLFEAARLLELERVVFGSSFVVSGRQERFGERAVTEDDETPGLAHQYAVHKVFNENQARDYREKHGTPIIAVRPANVTGHDKSFGTIDHVRCVTGPARGEAVRFPYADAMRCLVHVDDVAEAFARVTLADAPEHPVYNIGGDAIGMGGLAGIVRELVPGADISFEHETGAAAGSTTYLVDNSRFVKEFGFAPRSARDSVVSILDALRR